MGSECVVVLCTVPNEEEASRLGHLLVEKRLAACVNIVPGLRSLYWWEGKVQDDAELLLVIKTRQERFETLRETLVEAHPYSVPEVIALPIEAGHAPYLDWVKDNVTR